MTQERGGERQRRDTDRDQRIREAAVRIVDSFPPLTDEQRRRVIEILTLPSDPRPPVE